MKIAVLKETLPNETRVAASPETVKKFTSLGIDIAVETGAGDSARFSDSDFEQAGATISPSAADAIQQADLIAKVQAPTEEELGVYPRDIKLAAILSPFNNPESVEGYARLGIEAMAMDFMPRITRAQSMDVLSSHCLLYTSPSPRDRQKSRMPSSA